MPASKESQREKPKVVAKLKSIIPSLRTIENRRLDWLVSHSEQTSVFITFSQLWDGNRVWIDVNPKDLKKWMVYPNAFVVVVMGTHEDLLIIPVRRLVDIINNHHIKLSGRGDYKLNIMVSSNYIEIREAPGENLQAYRNNFGQLG